MAAIVVASLGIGATTAAFSIADHVITRPFPFPDADRLVKVWQDQVARGYGRMEFSAGNYRDVKTAARSFEAIGAYSEAVTAPRSRGRCRTSRHSVTRPSRSAARATVITS